MAEEGDNGQEKTEQPTSKRLEEARKKGQIPRSVELNAAAVLLLAGAGLQVLGGNLGAQLHSLMRSGLTLTREESLDESRAIASFANALSHAFLACAPILGLTVLAAVAAPLALGGWNMSFEVLAPDFTRLSPASGFARMFSSRSVVEPVYSTKAG